MFQDGKIYNDQYLYIWQDMSRYVNYISNNIIKKYFIQ